jgi:hypothetical protein
VSPARARTLDFTADDLIQLPRFDAAGAVALGEKLLAVAAEVPDLPRPIQRAKDTLEADLAGLRAAAAARLAARLAAAGTGDVGPTPEIVADADTALDTCWTALHDWLTGFAKLPDTHAETVEARALLGELYPDGLSFILLPYELEWGQSDLRLGRIASESLGERIRKLGGAVFIDALQAAHWQYGKLLGLPRLPTAAEGGRPSTGQALESFASTLRVYALKVTAHVEVDEPETGDLAKKLLDPLLHWKLAPRTALDVDKTYY